MIFFYSSFPEKGDVDFREKLKQTGLAQDPHLVAVAGFLFSQDSEGNAGFREQPAHRLRHLSPPFIIGPDTTDIE